MSINRLFTGHIVGFSFGEPHMKTLDGRDFTFNGLGEYVLFQIRNSSQNVEFELQGMLNWMYTQIF